MAPTSKSNKNVKEDNVTMDNAKSKSLVPIQRTWSRLKDQGELPLIQLDFQQLQIIPWPPKCSGAFILFLLLFFIW